MICFLNSNTFINKKNRISITNVNNGLTGASVANSIIGKPKTIAGKFWYTMLSAAGVLNEGSTSRNKIIPVLAVPVSIPNIHRNCSSLYVGKKMFAITRLYT